MNLQLKLGRTDAISQIWRPTSAFGPKLGPGEVRNGTGVKESIGQLPHGVGKETVPHTVQGVQRVLRRVAGAMKEAESKR